MKENKNTKDAASTTTLKKPKKRKLLKIIGIIALVLVLIFAGALFFIDSIIAGGIRYGGTSVLGVKVDVDSVRLSILRGSLELKGLTVENPPGSSDQYAFKIPEFHAALEPMSVLSDKIIINDITITGMYINYEPMLRGGSNLQLLLENLKKAEKDEKTKPVKKTPEKTPKEGDEPKSKPAKKIVIKHLLASNGQISMTLLGRNQAIPMPAIEMNDIGEGKDVGVAEAISMFLVELISNVVRSSGNILKNIKDDPVGTVEDIIEAVGDTVKNISNLPRKNK
ncbi:MAG: AsmA family protein [Victivallaceae bacterium]|nr:AsmA family protein [Victivallaceae bacterium]